jgi:hypothetical protein
MLNLNFGLSVPTYFVLTQIIVENGRSQKQWIIQQGTLNTVEEDGITCAVVKQH